MKTALILDGNYMLMRSVYSLHKVNSIYGFLHKSLENCLTSYKKWYPFSNVYLVSDSRKTSWRKKIYSDYKANRSKGEEIDWEFVFGAYEEFKESASLTSVRVLESDHIEGDDWISFLINECNNKDMSTITMSNDYDIKQLLRYNLNPTYINIMSNEKNNSQKIFMPKTYKVFLNEMSKMDNDDIFNMNDNNEFMQLLDSFTKRYEVIEVDAVESLVLKLISGDKSDNIHSVHTSKMSNGKDRGIGEAGAKAIVENYIKEFGEIKLDDPDLADNIADLIVEKKKLSFFDIDSIKERIIENMKLINLDVNNLPAAITNKMKNVYVGKD